MTETPAAASRPTVTVVVESTVVLVALVVVTAHVLATSMRDGRLWGADAYAFLPRAALWLGLAGLALAPWLAARPDSRVAAAGPASPNHASWVRTGIVLAVIAGAFWVFRIRHVLLGDGIPMTQLLPDVHALHPREPLASWIQQVLYRCLSPLFAGPGVPRARVVQECVAVGSVVAGVSFVVVAQQLARELVLSAGSREDDGAATRLVTIVLLAQGYVQVFFGYVENYAFPAVVAAWTLARSLRYLRGRGSLLWPLALAALGVALDFTAVVLGPAMLVLVGIGLIDRSRRSAARRDVAIAVSATLLVLAVLAFGPAHYPVMANVGAMLASGRAGADYLFSFPHLRDFINEHLLIGPFGLLLFVPLALVLAVRRSRPNAAATFLFVAGASVVLACATTPDLPLGYARDWDLFIPLGVTLTSAAVGLLLGLVPNPRSLIRAGVILAAVSLFHTLPWIALNASEGHSLERFQTLPLGGGRTENTIAFWYANRGDFDAAKRWLDRALAIDPRNSRALDLYGRMALDEQHPRFALRAYLIAVTLRPDKDEFRRQLAFAVAASGGPERALESLDSLAAGQPEDGTLLWERAMLLRAAGRRPESEPLRARALQMRPDLGAFPDTLPAVSGR